MRKRNKFFNILLIVAVILVIPVSNYAWNIICGISVNVFMAKTMPTKWEADSSALKGISSFYAAIAELQNVNVEPASIKSTAEVHKIELANQLFKESNSHLRSAKNNAQKLIESTSSPDKFGQDSIALWAQLEDLNSKFIANIELGHLPDLSELHNAVEITQKISSLGIKASRIHLDTQELYHTAGGKNTPFK